MQKITQKFNEELEHLATQQYKTFDDLPFDEQARLCSLFIQTWPNINLLEFLTEPRNSDQFANQLLCLLTNHFRFQDDWDDTIADIEKTLSKNVIETCSDEVRSLFKDKRQDWIQSHNEQAKIDKWASRQSGGAYNVI